MINNRKLEKITQKVSSLSDNVSKMTNKQLRNKTDEFKERIKNGESLDHILPEAFAVCREADERVLHKRPFDEQVMAGITMHSSQIAEQKTGEGKAVVYGTKIPTPYGWKKAEEIRIGDFVFDKSGNPTKVIGVYPQGKQEVYEVSFIDGRKILCNGEHLWKIYSKDTKDFDTVTTTKEMYDSGTKIKNSYKFYVPLCGQVSYDTKSLPMDPYLFGFILNTEDRFVNRGVKISSKRIKDIDKIAEIFGADSFKKESGNIFVFYKKESNSKNKIKFSDLYGDELKELMSLKREDRYIPKEYLLASKEQRLALLNGLMDSCGKVAISERTTKTNCLYVSFFTQSEKIADDFLELSFSLGFSCHKQEICVDKEENYKKYAVSFYDSKENSSIMFKFYKNAGEKYEENNVKKLTITNIKKLKEKKEQVCFKVDNKEHLFLVGDYIVTHNTLTATMPAYLNSLNGLGVHIVTVNDYLAKRDAEEMGRVFKFLGLSVSCIEPRMEYELKQKAYQCDIVYGTNKEFGFDYLRDNMVKKKKDRVQRELNYAIIDEVDSILIDEARTPLIIAGHGSDSSDLYIRADECVRMLIRGEDQKDMTKVESLMENLDQTPLTEEELEKIGDYTVNEKEQTVILTDRGVKKVEKYFGIENLGDIEQTSLSHHINQALKAHNLMHKDKNYIVKDGKVQLVDDFTGRVLDGRRYTDGLHQAIEAKERVEIQKENMTYATISLQNYFRLYNKITGMTGTAYTERTEFKDIYKLGVSVIPTHEPCIRNDMKDRIFQTENAKFKAIVEDIKIRHEKGQPILIGTPTIEQSEKLSVFLRQNGIKHTVLNAKNNELEASIVAKAGRFGAVTIATNMAGRGTDIMLGGNPEFEAKARIMEEDLTDEQKEAAVSFIEPVNEEQKTAKDLYRKILEEEENKSEEEKKKVVASGGLHVLGTARHEARRIDNQLRGRSGRQGDPGSSQFFVSLEDEIVRLFAGDSIKVLIEKLNIPEDQPIDNTQLSKAVETAQKRLETKNFEARKRTLEYDDVNNEQRQIIYSLRNEILDGADMNERIDNMFKEIPEEIVERYVPEKEATQEELNSLNAFISSFLREEKEYFSQKQKSKLIEELTTLLLKMYESKKNELKESGGSLQDLQRHVLLKMIDSKWVSYITAMENLRDSVSLVGYGTQKPIDVYKNESKYMFDDLVYTIKEQTVRNLATIVIKKSQPEKTIQMKPVLINVDDPEQLKQLAELQKQGAVIKVLPNDGKEPTNPIIQNILKEEQEKRTKEDSVGGSINKTAESQTAEREK